MSNLKHSRRQNWIQSRKDCSSWVTAMERAVACRAADTESKFFSLQKDCAKYIPS